ncbi:MAG: protein kinase domain-containing protein [Cellvibrionaceae bacterium]
MDNWERIEEIFNAALNIAPNARVDYVADKCEGDKQLKHQVLTLLNADDNSENYLSNLSETLYPLINDVEIDTVKHYRLLEKIGEGGMGVVYKAFDEKLHRTVAIKFLLSYRAKNPNDKQRFVQEAKSAAGLNHPNVCEVYEVDETEDGRLYIVTAFCEGKNLSELIAEQTLSIGDLFNIIIQLCDALKTAHNHGIIHRDLKPENIIVNDTMHIQLVDFGIAKTAGTEISQTGQVIGTFAYMSPEQFSSGIIDQRTDIWALGILLYESLTGERPFSGDNAAEIMYQIFNSESPKIFLDNLDFSTRLDHIIQRCLSIEKPKRYHSTDIVKNELQSLLNNLKATEDDQKKCAQFINNDSQRKKIAKTISTVNEYRKILTLGISCNNTDGDSNEKENKKSTSEIKAIIKTFSGSISHHHIEPSGKNDPELIVAHFGFPLRSEKYSANILLCSKALLSIHAVDTLLIHNLPVTISDDNKTGQRKVLGDINGIMTSLIHQKSQHDISVIMTESACARLRKRFPAEIQDKSIITHNETLYQFTKREAETSLSPNRSQYTTQLMGRYHELGLLESAWNDANDGDSRAVLITGEAGMGKTRLLHELTKTVTLKSNSANKKSLIIDCTFDPLQQDTAFYPIIKAISDNILFFEKTGTIINTRNTVGIAHSLNHQTVTQHSAYQWLSNVFSLTQNDNTLAIENDDTEVLLWLLGKANCTDTQELALSVLHESSESLKKKSFLLLNKIILSLTLKQPVLLIFEDLHWADYSSLEWIDSILSQSLPDHVLIIMTGRPELFHRWRAYSDLTQLSLNKLGKSETRDFIHSLHTESLLSEEIENRIIEKTAGNPLFIEEYVNMISRQKRETTTHPLKNDSVPDSLNDILLSRLDQLGHSKTIAQAASVIGRLFDENLLQEILKQENIEYPNHIKHHLSSLNDADIIFQKSNDNYIFKHALIRDALYQTINIDQRKKFHISIANVISNNFKQNNNISEERIAQHYSLGSDYTESIKWWLKAAKHAWNNHALLEVMRLCQHGIQDIHLLQQSVTNIQALTDIKHKEIELHIFLGRAATASEGYASSTAAKSHRRALDLATTADEKLKAFPSLIGIWAYYCVSAQHIEAENTAQALVDIADQHHSDDLIVEAYMLRGTTHLFRGNFSQSACDLLLAEKKLTADMQQPHINAYGQDPGVVIYSFFAILKEILGDTESALKMSQKAISSARRSQHPFSLSFALGFAVHISIRLRKNQEAEALIEENQALCSKHGIHVFRLLGAIQEGLLCLANGQALKGISLIEKNIPHYQSMGANLFMGTWHGVLSLTLLKMGDKHSALQHFAKGIEAVNQSGERLSQSVLFIAAQHLNKKPEFLEPLQLNTSKQNNN